MSVALALARSALRAQPFRLSLATAAIAAVVAATALLSALAGEVDRTLDRAVDARDVIVLARGAATEATSVIPWPVAIGLGDLPGVAADGRGRPLVSVELVVEPLARARSRAARGSAWRTIVLRGVDPAAAVAFRAGLRLAQGRWPRPGRDEAVVGTEIAAEVEGARPGGRIELGRRSWNVVGLMRGAGRGLAAEVWVDRDELASDARRPGLVSSVRLRAASPEAARALVREIAGRSALALAAVPAREYAARERRSARLLGGLAAAVALLAGAAVTAGAANVFHASVDCRRREIAALRALGAPVAAIVGSVLLEAAAVGAAGFGCGSAAALLAARWASFAVGSVAAAATTLAPPLGRLSLSPWNLAPGAALVLVACALASIGPAARAARLAPAHLLRGG